MTDLPVGAWKRLRDLDHRGHAGLWIRRGTACRAPNKMRDISSVPEFPAHLGKMVQ